MESFVNNKGNIIIGNPGCECLVMVISILFWIIAILWKLNR